VNVSAITSSASAEKTANRQQRTSCCIVGGGPAGATLALLLARRGISVVLLEAHKDFDRDFRGDTIHPSVMEILDEIGLVERLHNLPHTKIYGPIIQTASGPFQPFDLRRLKTPYPYIFMVPQSRFLEFIAGECARYPNFNLIMRAAVQKLIVEDEVVSGVEYMSPDGVHQIRSLLTVGADGRFSQVRQLAAIEIRKTSPPMDVLWFRMPRLPEDPETGLGAFGGIGRGRILIVLDRGDYWQAGLVFTKGTYQELRAQGLEALRNSIAETEPRFAAHAAHLKDWHQFSLLSVESSRCPRWYKPGLLLVGDAAHAMSPVGGVGINYAIQDAVVAANVLAGPLQARWVKLDDLREVQRQREWPTRIIQALQSLAQKRVIAAVLQSPDRIRIPGYVRLITRIPFLRDLPARLVAFGVRRVHVS
jgi:2-polyprenyl-6-methoxyphenol hydroxylase-like FAD-dependent oxidoreductase